jgi:hypothetical protein
MFQGAEGLDATYVNKIKVVIFLDKDRDVLGELKEPEQGKPRLVDVSETLFTG